MWSGQDSDSDWPPSHPNIIAQRFNTGGARLGGEFRVNTFTTGGQVDPFVASDASGNFVVVWSSLSQDGNGLGIFGQRYDASGTPQGGEFQVNTYTTHHQLFPAVATDASGDSIVVWQSGDQDGSGWGVYGQRYDASGTPQGSEFQVNAFATSDQVFPAVASFPNGGFVVCWVSFEASDSRGAGLFARRYDGSGIPVGAEFRVASDTVDLAPRHACSVAADATGGFAVAWAGVSRNGYALTVRRYDASGTAVGSPLGFALDPAECFRAALEPAVACGGDGKLVVTWSPSAYAYACRSVIFGRRYGALWPAALTVDGSPTGGSDGNGVLEAGEPVVVSPTWHNLSPTPLGVPGTAVSFTGPGAPLNPAYVLFDADADYGTVGSSGAASCAVTGNCYSVGISVPSPRPVRHWDAMLREEISPFSQAQSKTWTLHVGDSFADVPRSHLFYRFVETIFHHGITSGCSATEYCPGGLTTRAQIAALLLKAKLGPSYATPAAFGIFADVPASDPFAPWIEDLYNREIASGCSADPLLYCPNDPVTRGQMAVLLLKTLPGANYTPPPCADPFFADVPCSNPFAPWIYDLAARGIASGCGGGYYCIRSPVTRGQLGVFFTRTFGLKLYGP